MQALPAVFIITAPEAFVKQLFLKKSEKAPSVQNTAGAEFKSPVRRFSG